MPAEKPGRPASADLARTIGLPDPVWWRGASGGLVLCDEHGAGRGAGLGQEQPPLDMGSKDQREPVLQLAGMRTLPLTGNRRRR